MPKKKYNPNWQRDERRNFGREPDAAIARRNGVSPARVSQVRDKLGIPPYMRQYERLDQGEYNPVSFLTSVPLSSAQRQQLTQARLAQRVKQADLAERLGITAQYISDLEGGRREPAQEVLRAWCAALDLSLEIVVTVDIGENHKRKTG